MIIYFSSSVFAVFLIHVSPDTRILYNDALIWINANCSLPFLVTLGFLSVVFIVAVLLDKIRIVLWNIGVKCFRKG